MKRIDSVLPWACLVTSRQNGVIAFSDTLACSSCASFVFTTFLTSSVIHHWIDVREHGIYLINKVRAELIVVVLNQLCLFPLHSSSSRSLKKKSPIVKAPTVAKKRKREDTNVEGIL